MSTYQAIIKQCRSNGVRGIKTCFVADVKRSHSLTGGQAWNRHDPAATVYPCPQNKRPHIEQAMRELGDLK